MCLLLLLMWILEALLTQPINALFYDNIEETHRNQFPLMPFGGFQMPTPVNIWPEPKINFMPNMEEMMAKKNFEMLSLNKEMEINRMQMEKQQMLLQKQQEYEMAKLELSLQGPTNCQKVRALRSDFYPPANTNAGVYLNGARVPTVTYHETYLCWDPPRYPFNFFLLKTITKTQGINNSYPVHVGTNVKYIDQDGRQFIWEPDMRSQFQQRRNINNNHHRRLKRKTKN